MAYTPQTPVNPATINRQEPKSQPVVSGAKLAPQPEIKKIGQQLVQGTWGDVKNHMIYNLFIPWAKQLVLDTISMFLFRSPSNKTAYQPGTTTYNPYTGKPQTINYAGSSSLNAPPRVVGVAPSTASQMGFNYSDPLFATESDAVTVRDQVEDWIDRYGSISCARLYDMSGISGYPVTANQFGWIGLTAVANSRIISQNTPDGGVSWALRMPTRVPLTTNEVR